jgi:hypothetical protein
VGRPLWHWLSSSQSRLRLTASWAEKYGVHISAIDQFAAKRRAEIADARQHIQTATADELVGYWGAKRADRIAHRQQIVDDCEDRIVAEDLPVNELSALNKDKLRALHDMAEETTGLLTRSQVALGSEQEFKVTINGVEMSQAYAGLSDDQPAARASVPAPESEPEPVDPDPRTKL